MAAVKGGIHALLHEQGYFCSSKSKLVQDGAKDKASITRLLPWKGFGSLSSWLPFFLLIIPVHFILSFKYFTDVPPGSNHHHLQVHIRTLAALARSPNPSHTHHSPFLLLLAYCGAALIPGSSARSPGVIRPGRKNF